jgi:archaemetzincin
MGRVDAVAVQVIAAHLQTLLGLNARIRPRQEDPLYAFVPRRDQYEAGKILLALEGIRGGPLLKLAVVAVDLYTPILTFVFGESQLGGRAGVVSLFRLKDPDRQKFYGRGAKIALHEVGHLMGLTHCRRTDCLMGFSHNLNDLDTLTDTFCPACSYEVGRSLKNRFPS